MVAQRVPERVFLFGKWEPTFQGSGEKAWGSRNSAPSWSSSTWLLSGFRNVYFFLANENLPSMVPGRRPGVPGTRPPAGTPAHGCSAGFGTQPSSSVRCCPSPPVQCKIIILENNAFTLLKTKRWSLKTWQRDIFLCHFFNRILTAHFLGFDFQSSSRICVAVSESSCSPQGVYFCHKDYQTLFLSRNRRSLGSKELMLLLSFTAGSQWWLTSRIS